MPRLWRQPWSAIQPNSAQGPKDRWTQGSWAAGPPASSALTPAAAPRSTEGDAQQGSVEAKPLAVAPTPAAAKGVIADSGDSYKALIKVASLLGAAGLLLLAKARLGMWRGAAAGSMRQVRSSLRLARSKSSTGTLNWPAPDAGNDSWMASDGTGDTVWGAHAALLEVGADLEAGVAAGDTRWWADDIQAVTSGVVPPQEDSRRKE